MEARSGVRLIGNWCERRKGQGGREGEGGRGSRLESACVLETGGEKDVHFED